MRSPNFIFETPGDEIFFFKEMKPLFVAEEEFFRFYYHALLFKSEVTDPVKLQQFWLREGRRLQKFIKKNKNFYHYYKEGRTDKDVDFFTRGPINELKHYDLETASATSRDALVSTLLALERYDAYVKGEVLQLENM